MSKEQLIACIYSALRRIDIEDGIIHPDIEDWDNIYHTFGPGWERAKHPLPNLLDEDFKWYQPKQQRLFDDLPLRAVK